MMSANKEVCVNSWPLKIENIQEKEYFCLQCHKSLSTPSNRLVQDSCGHQKCRSCLLDDVDQCKQCLTKVTDNGINGDLMEVLNVTDNHTAVIQCNGNAQLNCNKIKEDNSKLEESVNVNEHCEDFAPKKPSKESKSSRNKTLEKSKSFAIPSHIALKTDPKSYVCTICNKSFLTKSHIKYHQYCTGELKPHKCNVCGKEFILKPQLQVHMYKHGNIKPFTCNYCQKSFGEKSKLSRHMILHSSEKKYICPECAKAFKSKESLKVHSLTHANEKPFACTICTAKFNHSSNLKKHLVSHSSEKAHMCDQCGRRFKLKWALSVHRKSHLSERPHSCCHCNKSFVNLKDLQRHILIHKDSKDYKCSLCDVSFRRKDNLRRHMKNTHPGKQGAVVKTSSTAPELAKQQPVVVDNPNAINVITASPAVKKAEPVVAPFSQPSTAKSTSRRSGSVINGPIKLAFKTPAFKSYYNITRDCSFLPPTQNAKPIPLAESIDMSQKTLLSPSVAEDNPTSKKLICENIISIPSHIQNNPLQEPVPEASLLQNRKSAVVKNIKFKVPEEYTNLSKQQTGGTIYNVDDANSSESFGPTASTSVIVNNSNGYSQNIDLHWRRRTSQNLVLKN